MQIINGVVIVSETLCNGKVTTNPILIIISETSYNLKLTANAILSNVVILSETLYNLLCDLQNVFEKKEVQLPSLAPREEQDNYLPILERFQRDYAAFICIRVSLQQTGADLKGLETQGFFT